MNQNSINNGPNAHIKKEQYGFWNKNSKDSSILINFANTCAPLQETEHHPLWKVGKDSRLKQYAMLK
jgi:hypothetical protein